MRAALVVVHRWAGLTLAAFLIMAGMTGALLAFNEELTHLSAPALFHAAPPSPGARPIDGAALVDRVQAQTGGQVRYAPLDTEPGVAPLMFVSPRPGQAPLGYDVVVADPYSGAVRAKYTYGRLADGLQNLMPFIYRLHYSFALGPWGQLAFGIAALVWTLDCFVGFWLTMPTRRRAAGSAIAANAAVSGPSWWSRWRPAWTVRSHARGHKLNFDLHRAGGLWLWPLLLVFAWSAVGFNLPQVHRPVMRALGASERWTPPPLKTPLAQPLGFVAAAQAGRAHMARHAREAGFALRGETGLSYLPASGAYLYRARTGLDISERGGTFVWLSAKDGRELRFQPPLGATAADGANTWLYALHMGRVFGLPYRILVALIGLAVTGLCVTGVLIWMKKRAARLLRKPARAPRPEAPRLQVMPG